MWLDPISWARFKELLFDQYLLDTMEDKEGVLLLLIQRCMLVAKQKVF